VTPRRLRGAAFGERVRAFVLAVPPAVPERDRRRFVTRNIAFVGAAIAHALLAVGYALLDEPFLAGWSLAVVPFFVALVAVNRRGRHVLAAAVGALEAVLHLGACAWILGPGSGASYLLLALAPVPSIGLAHDDRRLAFFWALLPMVAFYTVPALPPAPWAPPPPAAVRALWWLNTLTAFAGTATIAAYAARVGDEVESALDHERRRTRELLEVVVPPRIAARILDGERRIADAIPEVAVFFADLSGFTAWSSGRSALEVVQLLERVFDRLDLLAERHAVEKIKTIGDAYMAVRIGEGAGDDHVDRLAAFALDAQDAVRALGDACGGMLRVRAGLHVGAAVAGVIGRTRYAYDLWGDTVNVAARMESTGEVDRVQVSADVARRIGRGFVVTRRGVVDVKGKGPLETFWLGRC